MIRIARKEYTIQVTITEGNDEFWEGLQGKSGCDEVVELVKEALQHYFNDEDCYVRLTNFTNDGHTPYHRMIDTLQVTSNTDDNI